MDTQGLARRPETLPEVVRAEAEATADYIHKARAASTRKAYASDWHIFEEWCANRSHPSLPASAEVVATFISSEAKDGRAVSTITRRLAAISRKHRDAGLDTPTGTEGVKETLRGIRNDNGVKPTQKSPITADLVRELVRLCDTDTLKGKRDRAILLLGFAGAFRRSELVALKISDLEETKEGFIVHLRRSKMDQAGRGTSKAIVRGTLFCPVRAVSEWIAAAGLEGEDPLFCRVRKFGRIVAGSLSDRAIAELVKFYADKAGLEGDFSGHSLRSGFITSAADSGKDIFAIMDISGHSNVQTVRQYVRRRDAFKNNAGEGLL